VAGSKFKFVLIGFAVVGAVVGVVTALAVATGSGDPLPSTSTASGEAAPNAALPPQGPSEAQIESARVLNERGKTLMFDGKFEEASKQFRLATQLVHDPKYAFNLATALYQEGKFDESLAAIQAVVSANPAPVQLEKARALRSNVLVECVRQRLPCASAPIEAATGSNTAAAVSPDPAEEFNARGKTLMFAGKFAEASAEFRQAVKLMPEPKYFFNLATTLYQEGKFDEALTSIRGVQANNPTPTQVEKTLTLKAKILDECRKQGMTCTE
jgi:Flp pilus assembly protein TadD